jgi:hypothetical protein
MGTWNPYGGNLNPLQRAPDAPTYCTWPCVAAAALRNAAEALDGAVFNGKGGCEPTVGQRKLEIRRCVYMETPYARLVPRNLRRTLKLVLNAPHSIQHFKVKFN